MRRGAGVPKPPSADCWRSTRRSANARGRAPPGSPATRPPRAPVPGRGTTLRWVLVHTIEETARHNGHLDVLREPADGTTGD
nr:DUF664 domain-containing protein [Nocardiopsis sp. CNT312]